MSFSGDEIEDLKQILVVNNRTLMEEFDQKLDQKLEPLNRKFDELADFVRESLDTTNDATGDQLADHERRITTLEQAGT